MGHSAAPILEALADHHSRDRYGFTPPGHRQGRGADPRTVAVIGRDAFRSDLLATAGLDDRKSSHGYLSRAEQLMANAVGAEQAFFSTCGSSLSVKAAMLAVAGGRGELLISRDAHKSVVAGLVFGGVQPWWIRPRYDERHAGADVCVVSVHTMGTGFEQGSVFHQQGSLVDADQLSACADLLMTTSPNVMVYAALDGWRRQMAEHGHALLAAALAVAGRARDDIEALPGLHVLRDRTARGLDTIRVVSGS